MVDKLSDERTIPAFLHAQNKLAQFIRQPDSVKSDPDWPQGRARVYADLVYNNIEDFLSRFFPVLKEITPLERWQSMVRDFVARHTNKTPYFLELAQEFLDYLEHERQAADDPAFLLELAHYEWVELALDVAEGDFPNHGDKVEGDWLETVFSVSPLACSLAYQFPVHRICTDYLPTAPPEQPTFLLVYRGSDDV
ncbi:MAG TPA: putative DNA-binding domain-containing protein, partial [Pseudomonadales bacterium]|nr:putative DNA-binding domain-containing protein [Pseudomonadales bacterium]